MVNAVVLNYCNTSDWTLLRWEDRSSARHYEAGVFGKATSAKNRIRITKGVAPGKLAQKNLSGP